MDRGGVHDLFSRVDHVRIVVRIQKLPLTQKLYLKNFGKRKFLGYGGLTDDFWMFL